MCDRLCIYVCMYLCVDYIYMCMHLCRLYLCVYAHYVHCVYICVREFILFRLCAYMRACA
jgi:hypothetical protein